MIEQPRCGTVVIGLGNPLMGDDGLGLVVLEALQTTWRFQPEVEFVDGGTWGMNLLHIIEDASRVLFLDAIAADSTPGALIELDREALPRYLTMKISPHQVDLRDVLAVAEFRGKLPRTVIALGLQPIEVLMRTGLSKVVEVGVPSVVDRARAILESWGHRARSTGALAHA